MCDKPSLNERVCYAVPRKRACDEEDDECLNRDKTIFSKEQSKNKCLLTFEAETILGPSGASGSNVSGPICCGCHDVVSIVGLNGINVSVENGKIVIGTDGLQEMLDNHLCFCNGAGVISVPLPYQLDLPTYTNILKDFVANDLSPFLCSSTCATGDNLDNALLTILEQVHSHAESMAYMDPTGYGNWLDGNPLPPPYDISVYDSFTGASPTGFYMDLRSISC